MDEDAELRAHGLDDFGVAMADRADGDPCAEVEVRLSGFIPDDATLATGEIEVESAVCRNDIELRKLVGGWMAH